MSGGQIPDPITVAGETSGNKGLITEGKYSVNEFYGELSIPGHRQAAGRRGASRSSPQPRSFYSKFGSTFNYKFGGRWSPIRDVTLRGTFSTAFRAPNIPELFGGESDAFANVSDPCGAMVLPGSPRADACGTAANNGDDQTQLRSRVGGNENLRPEKAKVVTVGTVIEPRWAPGLYVTADYYHTKITDTINPLGANVILQGCYPDAAGLMPKYCEFITRDPQTGRVTEIKNLNTNVGSDELDGVDVTTGYDFATRAGRWAVQVVGTWLRSYNRTLADSTVIHGAGTWDLNQSGSGGAYPHLRFNANLGWALGGFAAGIRTYLIGGFKECGDFRRRDGGQRALLRPQPRRRAPRARLQHLGHHPEYGFRNKAGQTGLSVGVINLFDQVPSVVYNGFANTTDTFTMIR